MTMLPYCSLLLLSTITNQGSSFAAIQHRRSPQLEATIPNNTWPANFQFKKFLEPEPAPPTMPARDLELFNPLESGAGSPLSIWPRTSRKFEFYNSLDPEVAPSIRSSFGKRSAQPEPEPEAEASPVGFQDFKFIFPRQTHNGFFDSFYNALTKITADPGTKAEAWPYSSNIYNNFSNLNILAKRSAEPEPEAEAEGEPIGNSFYKFTHYNHLGQEWSDTIHPDLFSIKQRRSAEPDPEAEAKSFAQSIKDLHFNSLLARSLSLMSTI